MFTFSSSFFLSIVSANKHSVRNGHQCAFRTRWLPLSGGKCRGGTQTKRAWPFASSTRGGRRNHVGSRYSHLMWEEIFDLVIWKWGEKIELFCTQPQLTSYLSLQFNYMHECFERVFCELKWRKEVRTIQFWLLPTTERRVSLSTSKKKTTREGYEGLSSTVSFVQEYSRLMVAQVS